MTYWLSEYQERSRHITDIAHYMPVLFGTAARYGQCKVIELGVRDGDSTVAFLAAAELTGGHVWSVDIDPDCGFTKRDPQPESHLWTFAGHDSRSTAAQAATPDDAHVVLIDSSHDYAQTCTELLIYLDKLRGGGMLLMHDVGHPEYGPPVRAALDEILPQFGIDWGWTEYGGENGLGVVPIPLRWH